MLIISKLGSDNTSLYTFLCFCNIAATKLLSDSGEYINFLETQLERVQNYGIRLKDLENSFEGFSETVDIAKTLSEVKVSPVILKLLHIPVDPLFTIHL